MGGGVSSLPAEVTLAEAKELAGTEWQPAWEEKFADAEAKISRDDAVRCWTVAKANADGPASKGAGPPDERKDPGARRKKKDSATAKARWKKGAAKVRLTGSLRAKARARGKTSKVTTEGTTAEGLIRRKPLAKALWKKGVAKVGWIAHAKARAAAIERAQRAGLSEQLYEKLHGIDRSGVAEALDFSAIIAEKRGQHAQLPESPESRRAPTQPARPAPTRAHRHLVSMSAKSAVSERCPRWAPSLKKLPRGQHAQLFPRMPQA